MAAPTTHLDNSRLTGTVREDLLDVITNISPTDTPFSSGMKRSVARSYYHEWPIDELPSRGTKATIEGNTTAYEDATAPTRNKNTIEQIEVTWQISDALIKMNHAGMGSYLKYEIEKQAKVWKNALEYDTINSTEVATLVEGSTATKMSGALEFISDNVIAGGATADDVLTEKMYNTLAQYIWEDGGNPQEVYVGGALKRFISGFTGSGTKNVDLKDKRIVNSVAFYESDFGLQQIFLSRDMPATTDNATLMMTDPSVWYLAWLGGPETQERAKTRSATNGVIIGWVTTECRAEKANGKITGLSTTLP